jgi:gamma-glutamyltranspeptidase
VAGLNGLVTSGHPIASSAGLQILLKGGNAFDAAAAVGSMAALGEPEMNGIGGNGFMTIFHKGTGKVWSLSMAGAAPKGIVPADMTPETLNAGMKAGIVPGNIGGYLIQLQRFGTMKVADVFATAIDYAEKGYPIDQMLANSIARGRNNLAKYPTTAKIFLPNGEPLKQGDLLKNPDYAATLRKMVEAEAQALAKGASREAAIQAAYDRFYKGDIAQEIDRFFKANGGVLTAADLAAYKPEWQEPLHTTYRGHDVYSNPATSRGGFEVLMGANLIEPVDLKAPAPDRPRHSTRRLKPSRSRRPTSTATSPTRRSSPCRRPASSRAASPTNAAGSSIPRKPSSIRRPACRKAHPPPRRARRGQPSTTTTTANSTRRRSRSSTSSATPWAARPRSAGSSATTSSSATPGCC